MMHIYAQQTENHERRQAIACRRVSAGSALVGEVALSNLRTIATRCRLLAVMAVMVMFGGVAWGQTVFSGFTATSGTTGQSGQGYDKLVDNNTGTKWCIVQNNNTWSNTAYIEFEYATAFTPTGYILTTANDNSTYLGRNPKSWKIYGKLNSGDAWTELVSVTNNTTMQDVNYTPYEFNLTNTTTLCKYFRFEVSAIQNGGVFQLSEIQFRDNNILMSNNLSVTIPCDNTYNFYDDGGPNGNYHDNGTTHTATFTSDGDITITFTSISNTYSSYSSRYDYLTIYDGTTSGTKLAYNEIEGRGAGQLDGAQDHIDAGDSYTATSGTMTIVWVSDGGANSAGWAATITATGCPIVECEGFEGGTMPTGWTQLGSGSWSVGVGDYHITTGSHSGSGNALRTHTSTGDENYLITPSMDFSSTSYATLSFWYVNRNWPDDIDELTVYYRVNGGAWLELFHTAAEHSSWTEQIINLPAGALAANCQIGFKYTDHYGYGVGIDDVCITYTAPATSCPTTISSLSDWDEFCDCVNDGTEDYLNKTVTLVADLTGANTISTMAGLYESGKAFKGTFEGNGHTINVNIDVSGSGNTGDAYKGAAPFRYIDGATIQNLKVTGSVTSSAHHTAGLVGFCKDGSDNTIYNCLVSTNVTNNNPGVGTNTNNYIGGIIGHTQTSTNRIIGCVYNGTLTSAAFKGGMFGFAHGSTFYITDSYFGGNYSTSDNFSPIGCKSASYTETINFNNYYYNKDAGNFGGNTGYNGMNGATITNNGNGIYKHAYSVTGVGCVTVDRGSATASYNVSGITAYSTGIKYDDVFYGGDDDELALILGCTSGGVNGYSADHGTLSGSETDGSNDPYTLTMDAYNTVISAVESSCPITVINNTADWNAFCTCVNNGYDYNGQTVNLMANISVTTMAGNLGHPFRGTFEGNEHTITVDYTANYPDNNDHFTAPFICTDGATIQNLRIDGTINMGGFNYGSGLIGEAHGNNTITNCVSNVTINSSRSDDGTMGGFIVRNYGQYPAGSNEGTTTFNGCSFTGSLNGTNTNNCAGFVAWDEYVNWSEGSHYGKVVFNDCLFAPTAVTMSTTGSATFSRYRDDSKVTLNNSYYFQSFGTIQGKQAYSVTGIDGVTVDRNNVTATYSVSGITAYSTGIKYNSVFYGGDADVLSLTLNYSGGDFCGYAADYGTLSTSNPDGTDDPGDLTMVAHNTQISPASCFSVPICFDFNSESYSTNPTEDSGLPQGWDRVYSGTNTGSAPHIILNNTFDCGSRGIFMAALNGDSFGPTSIAILPRVSGITAGTQITFKARLQTSGRLRLGYMNGATFVNITEIGISTSCSDYSYTLTAAESAEIENNNRRLAFEWYHNDPVNIHSARFVFLDDICINAPVICEISYALEDSYGDGWNGASIKVYDDATNNLLGTWTIGSGNYNASGTLTVPNNSRIRFEWVSGSYDRECSFSISDINGEIEWGPGRSPLIHIACESCPAPKSLTVAATTTTATVSWTENGTATSWIVEYSVNSDFSSATSRNVSTNPTINLTGLTPGTTYYVRVKAVCGAGDESDWANSEFVTFIAVGDEWCDDFEGSRRSWMFRNGSPTNAWAWGTATNNGGTHSIYISNDGGTSNAYNNGSIAIVYAVKPLIFEDETYQLTFDLKQQGEGTWDCVGAMLYPSSTPPTASGTYGSAGLDSWPTGYSQFIVGAGEDLSGGNWVTVSQDFNVTTAGSYYLVIAWKNDGSGGYQPPAAVDNVCVRHIKCLKPTGLTVSAITTTSATVRWTENGSATSWTIEYSTSSDFSGAHSVTVSDNPHTLTGLAMGTTYYVRVRANCGGSNGNSDWSDPLRLQTDDDCATVGTGTSTSYYTPIYSSSTSDYSYSQQLYTVTQLTAAGACRGAVNSIKFRYMTENNLTVPIQVYIGSTSSNNLSSAWISDADLTLVYTSPAGGTTFSYGWVELPLSTPFYWDGESNILVAVRTTGTPSISYGNFEYTSFSSPYLARYISNYSSAIAIDPNNVATSPGSSSSYRPNIKFCIDCCTDRDGHLNITSDPACPATIPYGTTLQLTGSLESGYGAGDASWSSSDAGVATVSGGGLVTPVSIGSTTITYTREYDGTYCEASTTCVVTVVPPTPTITQTDDPLPECNNGNATLVASVPSVPAGYIFHWYSNSTCTTEITSGVSGTNNNTLSYPAASATQVWCRLEKAGTTTSQTFTYNGGIQQYTIPADAESLTLEVWGAQGGSYSSTYSGGLGGYMKGSLSNPTSGRTLYVVVGGQPAAYTTTPTTGGASIVGGYNGGGSSVVHYYNGNWSLPQGGGGATHIATVTGVLSSLSARQNEVLIVAGGGSGGVCYNNGSTSGYVGYAGGGTTSSGYTGGTYTYTANQTTAGYGGSFGQGASYTDESNWKYGPSGGGGGWYGGGNRQDADDTYTAELVLGHGGGSGYIKSTLTSTAESIGSREGNGQAIITAVIPTITGPAGNITIQCCGLNATIEFGD